MGRCVRDRKLCEEDDGEEEVNGANFKQGNGSS